MTKYMNRVLTGGYSSNMKYLLRLRCWCLNFPTSCPSLVYILDMHGICKSKYSLLIMKTSFEVKHCKIETVVLSRSAQAAKLKKIHSFCLNLPTGNI